jgi:hypothetical protein
MRNLRIAVSTTSAFLITSEMPSALHRSVATGLRFVHCVWWEFLADGRGV